MKKPIFELDQNSVTVISRTTFSKNQIRERQDHEHLLRDQIQVIHENLMVLAEEYGEWEESHRRIDFLVLDRFRDFVILELKRAPDEG